MEELGDVGNYEREWLLHRKNVIGGVTVNRTVAGNKRSILVPDPDEWSKNPVATVHNTASPKGQPLREGEVVKDHETIGGTRDRRRMRTRWNFLESVACDCVPVY